MNITYAIDRDLPHQNHSDPSGDWYRGFEEIESSASHGETMGGMTIYTIVSPWISPIYTMYIPCIYSTFIPQDIGLLVLSWIQLWKLLLCFSCIWMAVSNGFSIFWTTQSIRRYLRPSWDGKRWFKPPTTCCCCLHPYASCLWILRCLLTI